MKTNFKHIHLIVISFLSLIAIGSGLLSLPFANNGNVSFLDNLFTSVSSVCVTGLLTTSVVNSYTIFGQIIILILIQLGGLGLITFVGFILLLYDKKINLDTLSLIKENTNYEFKNLKSFVVKTVKYVMMIELLGTLFLSFRFVKYYDFPKALFNSLFLSVSAFCNAGIDNFATDSLFSFRTDSLVNFIVMTLIILGGLGYIVWFDLKEKRKKNHTRIVVSVSAILIIVYWLMFLLLERNTIGSTVNSTEEISMIALFQSVTLRTAGFSTIDFSTLKPATLFLSSLAMLIGGSPSGTAGGMKTTTVTVIIWFLISKMKNKDVVINNRKIPESVVNQSFLIFTIYIISIFIGFTLILLFENNDNTIALFFETVSAIGTVGLSANITTSLTVSSQLVIMLLMFIGRIGPLSILLGLIGGKNSSNIKYPEEKIIVG